MSPGQREDVELAHHHLMTSQHPFSYSSGTGQEKSDANNNNLQHCDGPLKETNPQDPAMNVLVNKQLVDGLC